MIQDSSSFNQLWKRRKFVATLTKAVGSGFFLSAPLFIGAKYFVQETWTVGRVMDLFIKQIPNAPFSNTVDTLKAGDKDIVVTGIVTTMFPTIEVVKKTIDAKANFIICHEPSFYNHQDQTDWLEKDDVYNHKRDLLKQHNIAIWRNHDYIHSYRPDAVQSAVVTKLGWQKYQDKEYGSRIIIPATNLQALIKHVKTSLGIRMVRYIGDLSQTCKKILLIPGAAGGRRHIEAVSKEQPDVLIVGEVQEWETAEYIHDAKLMGKKISLIIMGHADSEEPGASFMVSWIKQNMPGMPVREVPSGNPLSFL
jgi:putative NIF3 family GTP cyclohydrolase 1 type 2